MESNSHEDEALDSLNLKTDEQNSFDELSTETKLSRLDSLVQKSQVYSKIIAENLMANMKEKAKKKTTKSRKRGAKLDLNRQPKLISGATMRDYQLDGLDFMVSLYENGLNAILADEMGLGKTLQCISFIAFLMEQGISGPFLVVAPLSTVGNWHREFTNFSPSIKVLKYIGYKDEREELRNRGNISKYNVILTSYEISIRDHNFLRTVNDFKYLIVDEGHRLKNNQCLLIQKLKELKVSNRLLITGTPLQNNLNELWSLLNFILPDIFHDLHLFQQWFNFEELTNMKKKSDNQFESKLIEINIQKALIENLHTILKPFILRRLKKDVIKNLPPKKEYIVYVNMSSKQKQLYQETLNNNLFESIVRMYFIEYAKNEFKLKFTTAQLETFLTSKLKKAPMIENFKRRKIGKKQSLRDEESDEEFDEREENETPESELKEYDDDDFSNLPKSQILPKLFSMVNKEVRARSLQNPIMQLRNICNSPYLYYEPFNIWDENGRAKNEINFMKAFEESSSKLPIFKQLLDGLLANNHRILVFSQFTKMLDLLSDWLTFQGIDAARLDGSNSQSERQETIDNFNSALGPPLFLLSTRAGGLGINLTSADTVVLFDSDWNPQMDLQAIDRVHRIGQTKPVKIYRFVVRDSVEEVLLFKSYSKKILNKLIIRMNEHKSSSIERMLTVKGEAAEESEELMKNLKDLIELPTTFGHKFENNKGRARASTREKDNTTQLAKDEMEELLDRSSACYANDEINYRNIAVFETVNNMEQ